MLNHKEEHQYLIGQQGLSNTETETNKTYKKRVSVNAFRDQINSTITITFYSKETNFRYETSMFLSLVFMRY